MVALSVFLVKDAFSELGIFVIIFFFPQLLQGMRGDYVENKEIKKCMSQCYRNVLNLD